MIDWMKYRWLYLLISGIVILSGVFSLIKWGLQIGVEFKGGTLIEYSLNKDVGADKIAGVARQGSIEVVSVQKTSTGSYLLHSQTTRSDQLLRNFCLKSALGPES